MLVWCALTPLNIPKADDFEMGSEADDDEEEDDEEEEGEEEESGACSIFLLHVRVPVCGCRTSALSICSTS